MLAAAAGIALLVMAKTPGALNAVAGASRSRLPATPTSSKLPFESNAGGADPENGLHDQREKLLEGGGVRI
jgi:hypothetical protein